MTGSFSPYAVSAAKASSVRSEIRRTRLFIVEIALVEHVARMADELEQAA